ncbi:hypothetical protein [Sphingomonas jeddahensis]|uniref:hypothetical protein n=1 Tax=Sphingomonas jeddahensis TaxID=1915074 RepID=UPI00130186A8|nr:hypothetical protein [Sphingomonas jeddahensis]
MPVPPVAGRTEAPPIRNARPKAGVTILAYRLIILLSITSFGKTHATVKIPNWVMVEEQPQDRVRSSGERRA